MADREIVIKISEEDYQFLKEGYSHLNIKEHLIDTRDNRCYIAIANGTPLPKGHGDLIDGDELDRIMYHKAFETDSDMQKWDSGCWIRYKMFENSMEEVPTIIEADKERINDSKRTY